MVLTASMDGSHPKTSADVPAVVTGKIGVKRYGRQGTTECRIEGYVTPRHVKPDARNLGGIGGVVGVCTNNNILIAGHIASTAVCAI